MVFYLIGPSGGGKSTLCRYATSHLKRVFRIDLDCCCKGQEGNWELCVKTFETIENLPQGKNVYLVDIGAGTQHNCIQELFSYLGSRQTQVILITAEPTVAKANDPLGDSRSLEGYMTDEYTSRQNLNSLASHVIDRTNVTVEVAGDQLVRLLNGGSAPTTEPYRIDIGLIGINHHLQWQTDDKAEQVLNRIRQHVREFEANLVAEEWNDDASRINRVSNSTIKELTDKLGVNHIYCDPNIQQRQVLFCEQLENVDRPIHAEEIDLEKLIEEKHNQTQKISSMIRESQWLAHIEDSGTKRLILICGSDHMGTFNELTESENYNSTILEDLS